MGTLQGARGGFSRVLGEVKVCPEEDVGGREDPDADSQRAGGPVNGR